MSAIFRQRGSHGLQMPASYTWSHTLDVTTDSNGGGTPMNPYYWKADYCNSSKWQANGIVTLQTGVPFNVSTATGTANTAASGTYTPNLVHAATSECGRGHLVGCIDAIAFTVANLYPIAPTNFDYGNAGRNLLRFETFALLNHTNFANPSATINTSSFGNITGASGNRNIQIGAKLQF